MTTDDADIEAIIQRELDEGLTYLQRAGFSGGFVASHRDPMTDGRMFEIGGRFESCPDRKVYATVEIDPGRIGWRIEATLWEYPDSEHSDHEIGDLGAARVKSSDGARQHARILATAAWVAVKDYLSAYRVGGGTDPTHEYLEVTWHHDRADDPIRLLSELDPDRFERRKVEMFRDGRMDRADADHETNSTRLGEKPLPAIAAINAREEFDARSISRAEFDAFWARASDQT